MTFVQRDDMVQDLSATLPTHLSAVPFCQGDWMLVRFGFSPVAFRNVMTVASNFTSRGNLLSKGKDFEGRVASAFAEDADHREHG